MIQVIHVRTIITFYISIIPMPYQSLRCAWAVIAFLLASSLPLEPGHYHPGPTNNISAFINDPMTTPFCKSAFHSTTSDSKLPPHLLFQHATASHRFNKKLNLTSNQITISQIHESLQEIKPALQRTLLRALNVGIGTTGTMAVHDYWCSQLHLHSLHYSFNCTSKAASNPLATWFAREVHYCVAGRKGKPFPRLHVLQHSPECLTTHVLASFKAAIIATFSNPGFNNNPSAYSDTPLSWIYPYLLPLVRKGIRLVLLTVRSGESWWQSRWAHHHRGYVGLICHPRLWHSQQVLHPFDLVGCMTQGRYVSDSLVDYPQLVASISGSVVDPIGYAKGYAAHMLAKRYFVEAFAAMNTYNARITPQNLLHIACLWDGRHHHHIGVVSPFTVEEDRLFRHMLNTALS